MRTFVRFFVTLPNADMLASFFPDRGVRTATRGRHEIALRCSFGFSSILLFPPSCRSRLPAACGNSRNNAAECFARLNWRLGQLETDPGARPRAMLLQRLALLRCSAPSSASGYYKKCSRRGPRRNMRNRRLRTISSFSRLSFLFLYFAVF